MRTRQKIVLGRRQIRHLFDIPDDVSIDTIQVSVDPETIHVILSAEVGSQPWEEDYFNYDKLEDAEAPIIQFKEGLKLPWQNQ